MQHRGLLDSSSGGTWTATEAPLPATPSRTRSRTWTSVSCPTDGWCAMVGTYDNTSGRGDSFIDILSGTSLTSMEAPVPSDAQPETSADTFLKSVDCPSVGDCIAFGAYKNGAGTSHPVGFFDTLANGSWTAQTAPQPGDAAANQFVVTELVSCPSTGPCAASAVLRELGLEPTSRGPDSNPPAAPGPQWPRRCRPTRRPEATWSVKSSTSRAPRGVRRWVATTGTPATRPPGSSTGSTGRSGRRPQSPEPSNAGTGSSQNSYINGVSCTFDGCVGVGGYEDTAAGTRPLINTINASGAVTATEGPAAR